MKRFTSFLLIFSILFCFWGCTKVTPAPTKPVRFYYPAADVIYDGKTPLIQAEVRESAGYENDVTGLLNLYLHGPTSEALRSPFPGRVTVSRYSSTANTAVLELSAEFSHLVGIDLTVACACIAYTLFDLTQLDRVQICATDVQLDGQSSITLERDDIYFVDTQDITETSSDATAPS